MLPVLLQIQRVKKVHPERMKSFYIEKDEAKKTG